MGKRWTGVGLLVLLAPFQNCGQFQAADVASRSSLAQCRAGYTSQALRLQQVEHLDLSCSDLRAYACERRVFTPVADGGIVISQRAECSANTAACVDVVTRTYGTAGARTADNAAQFVAGADYNHVEVRCYHRWTYRGQVVLENEAPTVADALANVRQACLTAQSTGSREE